MNDAPNYTLAGAKAIGMLSCLLRWGDIPELHRQRAQEIVDEFERGILGVIRDKREIEYMGRMT